MAKPQPALQILGGKMREYRKQRGLSQAQLAAGICTQATISLIEKRNKVPSMNILMSLVARLGIKLEDVMVTKVDPNAASLQQVDRLLLQGRYAEAKHLLSAEVQSDLLKPELMAQFNAVSGFVALLADKRPSEAVYYFGRVLNRTHQGKPDAVDITTTLGMSLAYAQQEERERAKFYATEALHLFHDSGIEQSHQLEVQMSLYWYFALTSMKLALYDGVLTYTNQAIELAVANDRLFLLDQMYGLQAEAYTAVGSPEAKAIYAKAVMLAEITKRPKSAQALANQASQMMA